MPRPTQGQPGRVLEALLDYGCSDWVDSSSQRAADLYDLGAKLWRKEDLFDIEQLAQSLTAEKFTVRCIDGSVVHIKNPMFGVEKPIWKPYVKFQQFWSLVRVTPDGPPETYPCTYLVAWANKTTQSYDGPIENARQLFETNQKLWNTSSICETFTLQLHKLLSSDGKAKKVAKIVCFGLDDLNFKPPEWWRTKNSSMPNDEQQSEISMVERAMIHHAVALTMAGVARSFAEAGDMGVRLLTQDPGYSKETKDILREIGFEVVGEYSASSFAEIDDECIVFSPFPAAPVKQVVADLARPAIICVDKADGKAFCQPRELHLDPESPRTRQMWKEYETWGFPVSPGNVLLDASLRQLGIHVRTKE